MRWYVVALALFGGALLADEPKKDAKALSKKEVGKMMKDVHHGEKSPHGRAVAELKKDEPNWDQLAKDAKSFADMGAAFKGVELGYSSPAKYIESAKAFTKATGEKDKKAATEAFTGLTKSCAACHSYGGVGGGIK